MLWLGKVVVRHNFRKGNQVVHILAKEASKQSTLHRQMYFAAPSPFVEAQYLADKEGTHFVRLISNNVCIVLAELGN